ncbi:MAG: putative signal transducing protein [Terriglobia bacterium]
MDTAERVVRVWRGLDSLQAQFLRASLLDNGIDCYLDRDMRRLDLGMTDLGLWVAARDRDRARQLLADYEARMRLELASGAPGESQS